MKQKRLLVHRSPKTALAALVMAACVDASGVVAPIFSEVRVQEPERDSVVDLARKTGECDYDKDYLFVSGVSQYVTGLSLMVYGIYRFATDCNTLNEFHGSMLAVDLGVVLQMSSPVFSCISEFRNVARHNRKCGGNARSMGWHIFASSGMVTLFTLSAAAEFETRRQIAIGIAGASGIEFCTIACHVLAIRGVRLGEGNEGTQTMLQRVSPGLIVSTSGLGLGVRCRL